MAIRSSVLDQNPPRDDRGGKAVVSESLDSLLCEGETAAPRYSVAPTGASVIPQRSWLCLNPPVFPAGRGCIRPVCLPITPSECIDNGGRRAMGLMRSHRLSAVVDGAEHPCRAQGACVRHCNMLDNWRADGEHAPPPAPQHGGGTRVGSIRSALQHDRSATANVVRSADLGCP